MANKEEDTDRTGSMSGLWGAWVIGCLPPPSVLVAATMLLMVLLIALKLVPRSNDDYSVWSDSKENDAVTRDLEALLPATGCDNRG